MGSTAWGRGRRFYVTLELGLQGRGDKKEDRPGGDAEVGAAGVFWKADEVLEVGRGRRWAA